MKVFATVVVTAATCFALTAVAGQARHGGCVLHHSPCQAGQSITVQVGDNLRFVAIGWGCEYQQDPLADYRPHPVAPKYRYQLYCVPISELGGKPEVDLYRNFVAVDEYKMANGQRPLTFKVTRS
jgi:hypothetical protein